jgi:hypothetical protein
MWCSVHAFENSVPHNSLLVVSPSVESKQKNIIFTFWREQMTTLLFRSVKKLCVMLKSVWEYSLCNILVWLICERPLLDFRYHLSHHCKVLLMSVQKWIEPQRAIKQNFLSLIRRNVSIVRAGAWLHLLCALSQIERPPMKTIAGRIEREWSTVPVSLLSISTSLFPTVKAIESVVCTDSYEQLYFFGATFLCHVTLYHNNNNFSTNK